MSISSNVYTTMMALGIADPAISSTDPGIGENGGMGVTGALLGI